MHTVAVDSSSSEALPPSRNRCLNTIPQRAQAARWQFQMVALRQCAQWCFDRMKLHWEELSAFNRVEAWTSTQVFSRGIRLPPEAVESPRSRLPFLSRTAPSTTTLRLGWERHCISISLRQYGSPILASSHFSQALDLYSSVDSWQDATNILAVWALNARTFSTR